MTLPPVRVEFIGSSDPLIRELGKLNTGLGQTQSRLGTVDRGFNTMSKGGLRKFENGVTNLTLGMVGLKGATGKVAEGLLLLGAGTGPVIAVAAAIALLGGAYRLLTRDTRQQQDEQKALAKSFAETNKNLPGAEREAALVRLSELRAKAARLEAHDILGLGKAYFWLAGRFKEIADLEKAFRVEAITKIGEARRKAQQDGNERELSDVKRHLETYEATNETRYKENTARLALFYETRRAIIQEGTAAELKAAQGELSITRKAPAFTPDDRIAKASKVKDLEEKIRRIRDEGGQKVIVLNSEERIAVKALNEERLSFEQKIQAAKGNTFAVTISQIALEAQKYDELLIKQGATSEERTKAVTRFTDVLEKRAAFAKDEEDAGRRLAELDREREAIQLRVQTGQITAHQGEEAVAALELRRLPILRDIAAHAMTLAKAIGDPALIQAAAALNAGLDGVAANADLAGQRMAEFKANVESAVTNDLANFFSHGITEAKNFGDAIKGLARSIVQSIQDIVAQIVAAQIVKGITGAIFGGGGGFASGGAVLTGKGFAEGGFVSGAGGPTSDSIPAYLSNGEYVVNAASTARNFSLLEAINTHSFAPQTYRPSNHYAAGGLVTTAPTAQGNVTLHVTHEEGMVVKIIDKNMPVLVQNHRKHIRDTTR